MIDPEFHNTESWWHERDSANFNVSKEWESIIAYFSTAFNYLNCRYLAMSVISFYIEAICLVFIKSLITIICWSQWMITSNDREWQMRDATCNRKTSENFAFQLCLQYSYYCKSSFIHVYQNINFHSFILSNQWLSKWGPGTSSQLNMLRAIFL